MVVTADAAVPSEVVQEIVESGGFVNGCRSTSADRRLRLRLLREAEA
jgi:hypothetical protein